MDATWFIYTFLITFIGLQIIYTLRYPKRPMSEYLLAGIKHTALSLGSGLATYVFILAPKLFKTVILWSSTNRVGFFTVICIIIGFLIFAYYHLTDVVEDKIIEADITFMIFLAIMLTAIVLGFALSLMLDASLTYFGL